MDNQPGAVDYPQGLASTGEDAHASKPLAPQNSDTPHHRFDKPLTSISDMLIGFI